MTSPDPDTETMLAARAGDVRAFARLVERFLRPLASFFRRLGADASLAEDCAQEVFLKLYRTRSAYEPRAKFSTYLFAIARHHWIDVARHRAIGPPTISGDLPVSSEEEEGEALKDRLEARPTEAPAGAEQAEALVAVREAVAALSPEHREVFALAQGEGLRYQEIAEILRIPLGTVKSRMHAAMHAIRHHLESRGFEP